MREEKFLQRLARDFRIREEQIRDRLMELRRKAAARSNRQGDASMQSPSASPESIGKLDVCEREVLELLLTSHELFERICAEIQVEQLAHPYARAVFQRCRQLAHAGIAPNFERLLLEFEDELIKTLLVDLDERARLRRSGDLESRWNDVLAHFRNRDLRRHARHHQQSIEEGRLAEEEQIAALLKIQEQRRNRLGISASTDGQDAPFR
jgi:hypothetical protein